MPLSAPRPCHAPGCRNLTHARLCPTHQRQQEERREHHRRFYNTPRWKTERLQFLKQHPLCVDCLRDGQQTRATVVDHIRAHYGAYRAFWDRSNWQSLCQMHHSAKTSQENAHR